MNKIHRIYNLGGGSTSGLKNVHCKGKTFLERVKFLNGNLKKETGLKNYIAIVFEYSRYLKKELKFFLSHETPEVDFVFLNAYRNESQLDVYKNEDTMVELFYVGKTSGVIISARKAVEFVENWKKRLTQDQEDFEVVGEEFTVTTNGHRVLLPKDKIYTISPKRVINRATVVSKPVTNLPEVVLYTKDPSEENIKDLMLAYNKLDYPLEKLLWVLDCSDKVKDIVLYFLGDPDFKIEFSETYNLSEEKYILNFFPGNVYFPHCIKSRLGSLNSAEGVMSLDSCVVSHGDLAWMKKYDSDPGTYFYKKNVFYSKFSEIDPSAFVTLPYTFCSVKRSDGELVDPGNIVTDLPFVLKEN